MNLSNGMQKHLKFSQNNYSYNYYMACSLANLKMYEESLKYYNKAIELKPTCECCYNNKACNLYSLGRYEEAIICCDKAIELDPSNMYCL